MLRTMVNVVNVPSMGPGTGGWEIPVSLLAKIRTSLILTFLTEMRQPRPYTGGTRHARHHPFHCWARVELKNDDHFLSGNTQFLTKQ